ncbi:FHF complex subunit HOOK interacting protein 2A [Hyalella azteca]|uniref:FHF complex subunit HOOK interacting protein 2A n=1 Tax=Hyalella azteca TaxID=294128 RepID=A0A8B7MYG8_HYAAZ|nr:FHF complex subunit HOOK interacting protein 2A [Hyalella azteca]
MFSRLELALQAAVDVIAPPCARVEDLRYHWSQVEGACRRHQGPNVFTDLDELSYTDNSRSLAEHSADELQEAISAVQQTGCNPGVCNGGVSEPHNIPISAAHVPAVEETHAPKHLSNILRILVNEKQDSGGSLSPCLEFLVTNKVLRSLAAFAWTDRPLGIRQHAYVFMSGILQHLHHTLLHHTCIHRPLQRMVLASCYMTASPYEAEEMEFLALLCEKIRQDNSLVLLYIQPPPPKKEFAQTSSRSSPVRTPSTIADLSTPSSSAATSSQSSEKNIVDQDLPLRNMTAVPKESSDTCPISTPEISSTSDTSILSNAGALKLLPVDNHSGPGKGTLTTGSNSSINRNTVLETNPCETAGAVNVAVTEEERLCLADGATKSCESANLRVNSDCEATSSCLTDNLPKDYESLNSRVSAECESVSSRRSSLSSYSVVSGCSSAWTSCSTGRISSFPLIDALLNLCWSTANSSISAAAHECLLQLCSVREVSCCKILAHHSLLPDYIASRLAAALALVPRDLDPILLEDFSLPHERHIAAPDSDESDANSDEDNFPGKRELSNVFHWLAFLDKAVVSGERELRNSLCACVTQCALEREVTPRLSSSHPEKRRSALALVTRLLQAASSHALVMCLVCWLCDPQSVLPLLLQQCLEPPHQVQTLRLLQTAVQRSRGGAASVLLSEWLLRRRYVDPDRAQELQQCWSDEEDERARHHSSASLSSTFAPSNINKIVQQFLSLVPEELRSGGADDFASYCSDATRQCRDSARAAALHSWGREAGVLTPDAAVDGPHSPTTGPGPFLDTLLDLLQRLPEQDYDVNLQVTSLVASLAQLPHPQLHEFLLNPTVPLAAGARTTYSVLHDVSQALASSLARTPRCQHHLQVARHQLLGSTDSWHLLRDDEMRRFEAVIVLEEFCKELAAIAYAKYTLERGR